MLCLITLEGCASAPEQIPASEFNSATPPIDFALDLTILTGESDTKHGEAPLQQSRYVVLADGSLCYGPDLERAHGADWLPPITRILSAQQIQRLWAAASRLGLTDPAHADERKNFTLIPPPSKGEVVYLAEFTGWGRDWNFIRRGSIDQPFDPALVQFIRELAQLAWADERSPVEAPIMPKRYDFGADPYSRYRKQ